MASIKTIGTVAVIIGCFAIIYPRFMHPMVQRMFGMQPVQTKEEENTFPPHMRGNGQLPRDRPPPMRPDPGDIRQHMRPGPHPGMRAAAEMQKQSQGGTGRGMMGIVLPMYAIGICVYLVYTLFKVFSKRSQYSDPYSTKPQYNYDRDPQQMDRLGFPREMRGTEGEVQRYLQQKHQEKELEDLLTKLDDTRSVSEDEMRALQKRLEDTEAQMTRLLAAMQAMQPHVTTVNSDVSGAVEEVETVAWAREESEAASQSDEPKSAFASMDLSPDTESFEIVKNHGSTTPDGNSSSETSSPSLIQLSDSGKEDEEPREEEAAEGTDKMIESKPESEESTMRHRKAGNLDDE